MTTIALIGASSQIAGDLVRSFVGNTGHELVLFSRDPGSLQNWLRDVDVEQRARAFGYSDYRHIDHDVVLNFVGVGDPKRAQAMGASIFGITEKYDDLVLGELETHPERKYIFLSSGAVYGSNFEEPANAETPSQLRVNHIGPSDYYSIAKLHAEAKHRSRDQLSITDIRVFNYFSRTQDLDARFLITDIVRAIRDGAVLRTTSEDIVRDFLHPSDFARLVECIIAAPPRNGPVDAYTRAPVSKRALLIAMEERFGLRHETSEQVAIVNATGGKSQYFSLDRSAAQLDYVPEYTALDGVLTESRALLAR